MAATGSSRRTGYGRGYSNTRGRSSSSRRAEEERPKGSLLEQANEIWNESKAVAKDGTQRMDQMLLWIIVILVVVGTLMMFSASYAYAYFNRPNQDSLYFLKRQLIFAAIGLGGMYLISHIPVHYLKRMTFWMVILSTVMLIMVYFFPAVNDAHRWMLGFQPSEFSKFVVILFCAAWADTNSSKMKTWKYGIWPFVIVVGITAALILFEPHISCALIVILLCLTIMIVGGMNLKILAVVGAIAAVGIFCLVVFKDSLIQISIFERAYGRIDVWLDPFKYPQGSGWQTIQALYAISSGGVFGQGIGNSHQKYLYISEPQNDFIFAVICEELGFVGAVAIILLFVVFVWRGFAISVSNTNRFSMLLGIGITAQVGWQALLNIMVVTNCAPNTGISLPFFSYGGTSLVVLLFEMGVLLSVSRRSSIKKV